MRPGDANAGYVWGMIEAAREVVKFVACKTVDCASSRGLGDHS